MSDTVSKAIMAAGAASTGAITSEAINNRESKELSRKMLEESPQLLHEAEIMLRMNDSGIDWATWSQIAGIIGIFAMAINVCWGIWFDITHRKK